MTVYGYVITAALFTIGKSLISLYIGSSTIASSYGAAGSLIVVLLWIFYSAQIFSSVPSSPRSMRTTTEAGSVRNP